MTLPDPPVQPDGSCIVCGGDRMPKALKPVYAAALETDPFCSTVCARAWHGVPLKGPEPPGRRAYVSTLPPAA